VKDGLAAKRLNPCLRTARLIALHARGFALARRDLRHATPLHAVRMVDRRHRLEQPLALVIRDALEHRPIRRDRFEQLNRFAQPID